MPRKPRFFLQGIPAHIVQRGHCRAPVFFEEQDYRTYCHWMKKSAEQYQVSVHAFVLMTNHVHILATPLCGGNLSLFMQYLGRRYVPYINHKYGKSGSIWEGRFKASLVQAEQYLLAVMRYIELNPVRANMVADPESYPWSSYAHNAGGKNFKMIRPHDVYRSLGPDKEQRVIAYKKLFGKTIGKQLTEKIGAAWQTGTPMGNDRFKALIEESLDCKVGTDRRGRPSLKDK